MRRILLAVCIVALLALVLNAVGGKDSRAAQAPDGSAFTTVSEAVFSLRSSGSEDATSYLIGSFTGNSVSFVEKEGKWYLSYSSLMGSDLIYFMDFQ